MMSSFSAMFSGDTLYIKTERIEKIRLRNISISSEFANGNYKELARKYNLSVRQIRNIVDRHNF
jgi:Mor family transcriptional regulator